MHALRMHSHSLARLCKLTAEGCVAGGGKLPTPRRDQTQPTPNHIYPRPTATSTDGARQQARRPKANTETTTQRPHTNTETPHQHPHPNHRDKKTAQRREVNTDTRSTKTRGPPSPIHSHPALPCHDTHQMAERQWRRPESKESKRVEKTETRPEG